MSEPVSDPITEPITEPVFEPINEPVSETVSEPVIDWWMDSHPNNWWLESQTSPVSQPVQDTIKKSNNVNIFNLKMRNIIYNK